MDQTTYLATMCFRINGNVYHPKDRLSCPGDLTPDQRALLLKLAPPRIKAESAPQAAAPKAAPEENPASPAKKK